VRRGAKSVGEIYDGIAALAAQPEESQSGMFARIFPDALSWLRLGSLAIDDTLIADASGGGSFAMRRMTLEDLSTDSMAKASIEGVAVETQGITSGFEAMSVEGVGWPSAEAWAAVSAVEEQRAAGSIESAVLERAAANLLKVYPDVAKFRLAGVSVSLGGTGPLTLAELQLTQDSTQPSTTVSRGALRQLVIPAAILALNPDAGSSLSGLGYTQLVFDGESEVNHDRGSGAYVGNGKLAMQEGGTLESAYTLSGLDEAAMQAIAVPFLKAGESDADMQELSAALDRMKLDGFSISWRDDSLVRRLVTWWAQQQQMPEAALAQGLADAAAEAVKPLSPALADSTRTAVNAFLLNPQSLTLTAEPPTLVGVGQLMRSMTSGFPLPELGMAIDANH
jgi:hypothetical protein